MSLIFKTLHTFLLAFVLTGCVLAPPLSPCHESDDTQQKLFLQSFEELMEGNGSPSLMALQKDYPDSVWTERSEDLAVLLTSRRELIHQNSSLQNTLSECEQQGVQAKKKIEQLDGDLRRMKELVIDMELRSR